MPKRAEIVAAAYDIAQITAMPWAAKYISSYSKKIAETRFYQTRMPSILR
jgi:hypothetical protein